MAEANFYKTLGLPDYSGMEEVKRAFKELAKRYHPDINPNNTLAEERFKEISHAYHILGDEKSKQAYDIRLSGLRMYFKTQSAESKETRRKRMQVELRNRRKKEAEARIIADWKQLEEGTPLFIRRGLNYAIMATGVLLIFQNWFYSFVETYSPFYVIGGVVLIILANVREQNIVYTRYLYRQLKQTLPFSVPRRIMRNIIIGIILSISVGIGGASLMANYHLKYRSAVVNGFVYADYSGTWRFEYVYQVEGKTYYKQLDNEEMFWHRSGDSLRIRYALFNPNISEIIKPE